MHIHMHIHAEWITNDTTIKGRAKTSLTNIFTSQFICKVRKGYSRFYCERELETEQNCNILTPHSYGRQRCVFLVLQMLNRRPWGPAFCWMMGFLYCILSATSLGPNSIGGLEPLPAWCGFPLPLLVNKLCLQLLLELWLLSWLSYIIVQRPTQSPTRSLESHV